MGLAEPMIDVSTVFAHDKALIVLRFAILVFASLFVEVVLFDTALSLALTVIVDVFVTR